MEYILNESPVKTTNGFGINNIKLDLDIPSNYSFNGIEIISEEVISTNKNGSKINTGIGLNYDKSYEVNIVIPKDKVFTKPIYINYLFSNNDVLISKINIIYEINSKADIIFKFKSIDEEVHYNHINIDVISNKESSGNISIINLLNKNSYNFIDINGDIKGKITYNILDIGGINKISRIFNTIQDYSICNLNTIYIGLNDEIIDTNYYMKNKGVKSISNIKIEGVLDDYSIKHFKGIIDFISGSSKSRGIENENVVLLSNTCKSRSLPMLLCGEEDVEGSHGVSTGKIDNDKLFYLMSRGLDKNEAINLIIKGNFNGIINGILSDEIKEEVLSYIDTII